MSTSQEPGPIRRFVRFNGHLIWMIPPLVGLALCIRNPMLILALVLMELFSLGLHQYVHHEREYFGSFMFLIPLGIGTLTAIGFVLFL